MIRRMIFAGVAIFALLACATTMIPVRTLTDPDGPGTVDGKAAFLKAHLKDGSLLVMGPNAWQIDTVTRTMRGQGRRLDFNRRELQNGELSAPMDSVALYETNSLKQHRSVVALAIISGISAAVTISCLADPKACFGSCPTFYVTDGANDVLQAEGFSASIAPALEATDLDALHRARPRSRRLDIHMTNEALETHVVRRVHVLAVRRQRGNRVFATQNGEFWESSAMTAPTRCDAAEGDCREAVAALDGVERFSGVDSTDLAARESIELTFPRVDGRLGIVIGSRQTLLTTYVLYQALAYLGPSAGSWLAQLNTSNEARQHAGALGRILGGIDVQLPDSAGPWQTIGSVSETGPLATDAKVVPLPLRTVVDDSIRVRLMLTRGLWRIDQVALVPLDSARVATRLHPLRVRRDGRDDKGALAALRDTVTPLVTLPGDAYTLTFELPSDFADQELFLESRGYYIEWLRNEWKRDVNPMRAALLLTDPAGSLRLMAPEFKKNEARMEQAFWSSRYVRP